MKRKTQIVIIGIDPGEILEIIIDAIAKQELAVSISAVIGLLENCSLIQTAQKFHIPTEFISLPPPSQSQGFYDQPLYELVDKYHADLIILIGYTRILSPAFVKHYPKKIMNVHGSLLPKYQGLIGEKTQEAVLASGDKKTGCTIHWVTEEVDAGPIIIQKTCKVDPEDIPQTLRKKLTPLAGEAYVAALKSIINL